MLLWRTPESSLEDALGCDMRLVEAPMKAAVVYLRNQRDKKPNAMSRICQITGKKAIVGNNVSHSKRRTKRKFNVNLFNKKFYWVEEGAWIVLTISAAGLRTINKKGLDAAIKEAATKGYLTEIKYLDI